MCEIRNIKSDLHIQYERSIIFIESSRFRSNLYYLDQNTTCNLEPKDFSMAPSLEACSGCENCQLARPWQLPLKPLGKTVHCGVVTCSGLPSVPLSPRASLRDRPDPIWTAGVKQTTEALWRSSLRLPFEPPRRGLFVPTASRRHDMTSNQTPVFTLGSNCQR